MIRFRWLQDFLHFAARRTEGGVWCIFHNLIRRIYLGPVLHFLEHALKPGGLSGKEFKLIARHSVTSRSDFNAFMSDLDLSVVLSDAVIEVSPEVVRRFFLWKRRLPFIGELEIYSDSEFSELNNIFETKCVIYPEIRRIRKLAWMENAIPQALSRYHRDKAERSVSKILLKVGIEYSKCRSSYRNLFSKNTEGWIGEHFQQVITDPSFSAVNEVSNYPMHHSDYLATTLWTSSSHETNLGELSLPALYAWILIALTPSARFENPNINDLISRLRAHKAIHTHWTQISRIECLVYKAVIRAQQTISEGERSWLQGFIDSWNLSRARQ